MTDAPRPWRATNDGLRLELRVQPGAAADGVEGIETLVDGAAVLKVRVTAPPEDGRANAALIKLLSKRWKLPKSHFELVAGQSARRKSLLLRGDPGALAKQLEQNIPTAE